MSTQLKHSVEAKNREVQHHTWHMCEPWTLKLQRLPTTANSNQKSLSKSCQYELPFN